VEKKAKKQAKVSLSKQPKWSNWIRPIKKKNILLSLI